MNLREAKKRRTRDTILRAALELFAARGFQATTIPEIAHAAGVSPRTVSVYFPAKEDLVFTETEDVFARLADRLRDRLAGETATDALRAWLADETPGWQLREDEGRILRRIVESDEALGAYEQRHHARAQQLIAEAIAHDLGESSDALEPRMAAAALFAVLDVLTTSERERGGEPGGECTAASPLDGIALLDRALVFVGAGIVALRDGPTVGAKATAPESASR